MLQLSNTPIPKLFSTCIHNECTMASTCLRNMAYNELVKTKDVMYVINPTRCTKDTQCPNFCDSTPVRFARGFINFQQRMYPGQYQKFMTILIEKFSRNPYFQRRRGDIALSPQEQAIVTDALHTVGVTEPLDFDAYEYQFDFKE